MNDYIIVMDETGKAHLEHRSHKYTKREWQGKGWRYWYGTGYKEDAKTFRKLSKDDLDASKRFSEDAARITKEYLNAERSLGRESDREKQQRGISDWLKREAAEHARTAYNSQKLYEQSLAGKVEKGKKIVNSLLEKLKKKVNDTAIKTAKKLGAKTERVETRTDISTGQKWKRVNGGPWEKVK